jgi:hypothetical protein
VSAPCPACRALTKRLAVLGFEHEVVGNVQPEQEKSVVKGRRAPMQKET